ncbi:MAG: aminotransferase class I/II-fold pyridoxal phosphate-dependent enzyme [Clostridia bacterium]|nr:aminotransferase class I/II-fold pyridoxal phosphate-dependent enzyme [Clostridia bacterium]
MRTYEHGGDVYAEEKRPMDFSVNIDPLGMPESVAKAAVEAVRTELSYPDPFCRRLTAALSERYGVPVESIICGNGASDLLLRLCAAVKPRKVLVPRPGFSEYERCASLFGAQAEYYDVLGKSAAQITEGIKHKLTEAPPDCAMSLAATAPQMLFICRPNNPDGSMLSAKQVADIAELCERIGTLLVVDECFLEFTKERSAAEFTKDYRTLVIVNAFTKTYSMAGLRLGFMFCSDRELMDKAYALASPWSVSAPAQAAGIAACKEAGFLQKAREYIDVQREYLVRELKDLGFKVCPSKANFLLVKEPEDLRKECGPGVRELLAQRGIKVRDCRSFNGLDDTYIRLGVRTEEENKALVEALKDIAKSR